jgi:hypothetical protein
MRCMPQSSALAPRLPTSSEIEELKEYLLDGFGLGILGEDQPKKQTQDYLEQSAMAVFDNGQLLRDGYGSKVMTVIYPNEVGYYEVFTWDESQHIKPIKQHEAISEKYD